MNNKKNIFTKINKLFLISISFVFLTSVVLVSCQKEELENVQKDENNEKQTKSYIVYSEDNVLTFPSEEDYEAAIEELNNIEDYDVWEEEIGFFSMRREYSQNSDMKNIPIDDELFATLLNSDGIIQIGDYIFKIDMENEKIYVASKGEDCEKKNAVLKSLNFKENNSEILIFSTDDDVFELLNGDTNTQKGKTKYCRSRKMGTFSLAVGVGQERIYWKNHYLKAGIYYSLSAEMYSERSNYDMTITVKSGCFWRNKKKSGTITARSYSTNSNSDKVKAKVYSSTRRLTNYKFDVDFEYKAPDYYVQFGNFVRNENNYCYY